jgi:TonB-dependent SusC/RagA subfamily outer membrane receptor
MRAGVLAVGCLSLLSFSAHPALGQQGRTVLGQVKDALTGRPIARGEVVIPAAGVRDSLRANGVFVLHAPAGPFRLVVTSSDYWPDSTDVTSEQDVIAVRLRRAPVQLGQVVVTGEAQPGGTRAPIESVQEMLSTAPGVDVQQNSGAPGTSFQVRLEGVTTILGDTRPLWVLDGVIVSDDAVPSGITTVTGGLHADAPSRILDLNPNDVARIEVLQGAAATAGYGSRGANGVVLITTKRGPALR